MSDLEKYWPQWLDTWHRLSAPDEPPFYDEFSAAKTFSELRYDKDAIRSCLADFPFGQPIADHIIEIIDATSLGEEAPRPCGGLYLYIQSPYRATDAELSTWVSDYILRVLELADGESMGILDRMPSLEIVRCDNPSVDLPGYENWYEVEGELSDHISETVFRPSGSRTVAAYHLITEPLYHLACQYDLAYFACWPFAQETFPGPNPFRYAFNLWRSNAYIGPMEPDVAKIYAPKLATTT